MNELKAVFGLITDIQYADCENGESWDKIRTRFYRNSLNLIDNAIAYWKDYESKNQKLSFVIQLGDIIDAKAKRTTLGSVESMERVLNKFNQLNAPDLLHIWGNHEMYNFLRSELNKSPLNTSSQLRQATDNANYYVYDVCDTLVLICLDFYEFSVIGYENDKENSFYTECLDLLRKYNKNENLNNEKDLPAEFGHYLAFNGGLYGKQLDWLKTQLGKCKFEGIYFISFVWFLFLIHFKKNEGKKAIVCGHVPIK